MVASILIRETVFLPIYYQPESSITIDRVSRIDEAGTSWLTLIMHYLSSGELLDNRVDAHKVQATKFSLVNEQLYKWSLDGLYLKCLTTQQGQYVLAELHEGVCENYSGGITFDHRAHTQGYYWPTMRADAVVYVKK